MTSYKPKKVTKQQSQIFAMWNRKILIYQKMLIKHQADLNFQEIEGRKYWINHYRKLCSTQNSLLRLKRKVN